MTQDDQQSALAFLDLLCQAAKFVDDPWFSLSYAGPGPAASVYRERVYCYELYHQIRKLNDDETTPERANAPTYLLSGEIDKSGLDAVVEGGRHKPDFVWHEPGTCRNAVVVEVKSAATLGDADKDLQTLAAFLGAPPERGYARGVLLVYGSGRSEQDLRTHVLRTAERVRLAADARSRINLLCHPVAGMRAKNLGTLTAIGGT